MSAHGFLGDEDKPYSWHVKSKCKLKDGSTTKYFVCSRAGCGARKSINYGPDNHQVSMRYTIPHNHSDVGEKRKYKDIDNLVIVSGKVVGDRASSDNIAYMKPVLYPLMPLLRRNLFSNVNDALKRLRTLVLLPDLVLVVTDFEPEPIMTGYSCILYYLEYGRYYILSFFLICDEKICSCHVVTTCAQKDQWLIMFERLHLLPTEILIEIDQDVVSDLIKSLVEDRRSRELGLKFMAIENPDPSYKTEFEKLKLLMKEYPGQLGTVKPGEHIEGLRKQYHIIKERFHKELSENQECPRLSELMLAMYPSLGFDDHP